MNRVLLTGRLTRDSELRSLPSGKTVTNCSLATNEHGGARSARSGAFLPTSERIARHAGELLGRTGTSDAIDAMVAAEALEGTPATILTGDPGDSTALVEAGGGQARVTVQRI